jgi:peptidoglycan/LPS O-acetylase OafA/YrhL
MGEDLLGDTSGMTSAGVPGDGAPPARPLPPVQPIAVATLVLVVIGGIYLAAHIPQPTPLGPAIGLLVAASTLLVSNLVLLARVREFAWDRFRLVAGWTLLVYLVVAGMLEYVFVYDHTPGGVLAVLTLMLAVFAVNVPLTIAFTVARYQPIDRREATPLR